MTAKRKLLVIVNPVSGNGEAKTLWEKVKAAPSPLDSLVAKLRAEPVSTWPIIETDAAGTWQNEARAHLTAGFVCGVIGFGGDGTFMQIASVLHEFQRTNHGAVIPPIIPIPSGRGNDLVRALSGFVQEDQDYFDWMKARNLVWTNRPFDLAGASGRTFVNMASLGYGGRVVERVQLKRSLWSKSSMVYQIEGALALLERSGCVCQIHADGNIVYNGPFFGAFIGNGMANGGGLFWSPNAKVDDGKLDAVVFARPTVAKMASTLAAVKKKQAPTFPFTRFQAGEIVFHFDREIPLELDGDYIGRSIRHEFRVFPKQLELWLPAAAAAKSAE